MNGHVPPSAAGGGEHHVAAPALEHPRLVVRGQVSVEAAAAEDRIVGIRASHKFRDDPLLDKNR